MSGRVDWDNLKDQYELFNVSLVDIAQEQGVILQKVEYVAEKQGWERQTAVGDRTDEAIEELQDRTNKLFIVKQSGMAGRYILFETTALKCAQDIIEDMDRSLPTAAQQLRDVVAVVNSLKEKNSDSAISGSQFSDGKGAGVTVKILNQVAVNSSDSIGESIEIQIEDVASDVDAPSGVIDLQEV